MRGWVTFTCDQGVKEKYKIVVHIINLKTTFNCLDTNQRNWSSVCELDESKE